MTNFRATTTWSELVTIWAISKVSRENMIILGFDKNWQNTSEKAICWYHAVLMLGHRRRRWAIINTACYQRLVFPARWHGKTDRTYYRSPPSVSGNYTCGIHRGCAYFTFTNWLSSFWQSNSSSRPKAVVSTSKIFVFLVFDNKKSYAYLTTYKYLFAPFDFYRSIRLCIICFLNPVFLLLVVSVNTWTTELFVLWRALFYLKSLSQK